MYIFYQSINRNAYLSFSLGVLIFDVINKKWKSAISTALHWLMLNIFDVFTNTQDL